MIESKNVLCLIRGQKYMSEIHINLLPLLNFAIFFKRLIHTIQIRQPNVTDLNPWLKFFFITKDLSKKKELESKTGDPVVLARYYTKAQALSKEMWAFWRIFLCTSLFLFPSIRNRRERKTVLLSTL